VRHADQIVVMEQGRIVESGHHDDLIRRNGAYANLWRVQAGLRQNEELRL
jgi:ATP-binding cassette subfamily B protein